MSKLKRNSWLIFLSIIALFAAGCLGGSSQKTPVTHTLTIEIQGEGTVEPEGETHQVSTGAVFELKANPAENWEFEKWIISEREESDQETSVLVDKDLKATAIFRKIEEDSSGEDPQKFNLTIDKAGEGTVTPDVGTYSFDDGTTVELKANPAENWKFEKWIINGVESFDTDVTIFLDKDFSATAMFKEIEVEIVMHTLTLAIVGEGTTTPVAGTYDHEEGKTVLLRSEPAEGWRFSKWNFADSGGSLDVRNQNTYILMNRDKMVTAHFEKIPEVPTTTLTIEVIGEGTVTPGPGVHTIPQGNFYITAEAADGWELFGWIVKDAAGAQRREMLRGQSDWRYNDREYRVWGEDNHLTVIFADEFFTLDTGAEYVLTHTNPSTRDYLPLGRDLTRAGDSAGNFSYPEDFEVKIDTATQRSELTREHDEFRGWTIQSALTGEYLDSASYFADPMALETTVRIPREDVIVTAEWARWWRRVASDDNSVGGIISAPRDQLGRHYFDLSTIEPGATFDFEFNSQSYPARFKVYYGDWESITSDMPGMLLFNSGWISSYPREVNEEYFPGVDYPYAHPDVESSTNYSPGGLYKDLFTKQSQFDYLLIEIENFVPDINWQYRIRRSN